MDRSPPITLVKWINCMFNEEYGLIEKLNIKALITNTKLNEPKLHYKVTEILLKLQLN